MRHREAFIEVLAPQKIAAKTLSVGIFYGTDFYKRQEKKLQREEKDDFSLANRPRKRKRQNDFTALSFLRKA